MESTYDLVARPEENVEISLFPIPGCVSFPLSSVPLHIFEPRYRQLLREAVRDKRRIGICHTKRVISPAKHNLSTEEALRSNQATYEPCEIFGAGFAEIVEQTTDGRLLAEIQIDSRYEIVSEIQTIPYRIVKCRRFLDEQKHDPKDEHHDANLLRDAVIARLTQMSEQLGDELSAILRDRSWQRLSLEEFSFKIFQIIRFEPETLQMVLEFRSPRERLRVLLDALGAA